MTNTQTTLAVVTHQQGSWKWQNRYALVEYRAATLRDGTQVWRSSAQLNGKVTPRMMREYVEEGIHYGSLHNMPIHTDTQTSVCGGMRIL